MTCKEIEVIIGESVITEALEDVHCKFAGMYPVLLH